MITDVYECHSDDAKKMLLVRLREQGVKEVEFKKRTEKSKRQRICLTGNQCDLLLKKWRSIVLPELGRTPTNLEQLWIAFDDVWKLIYACDNSASAKIRELSAQNCHTNRTKSLLSNSMHILLAHVPRYLAQYAPSVTAVICLSACALSSFARIRKIHTISKSLERIKLQRKQLQTKYRVIRHFRQIEIQAKRQAHSLFILICICYLLAYNSSNEILPMKIHNNSIISLFSSSELSSSC